jgi:hypothetical protein
MICVNGLLSKKVLSNTSSFNGNIPMKPQIEYAHPRVVIQRKLVIVKKIFKANHSQQLGEKHFGPIGCAIMIFWCHKSLQKI